jgi:16S rRNA (adenine1518-N6/adenine1519-N6)-dimethyltransferase
MRTADRQTRSYLMKLFEEHGFHPRTDLGQNFLIDLNLVQFVVGQAELCSDDVVLEIGAGTGSMTTMMAPWAGAVISVEVDRNMHMLASRMVEPFANVTLLQTDALKNKNQLHPKVLQAIDEALAVDADRRLKLVANLPYNIATPVVSNLVATELPWSRMVVTIQYELGLRMQARPATSQYGSLAVWLQSQCEVELLRKVPPTVFWPRPKVNSAIMKLTPDPAARALIDDRPFFHDYVRRLFHQRRKMLRSLLVGMYRKQLGKAAVDDVLGELNIEETARAEELPVSVHVNLANRLYQVIEQASQLPAQDPET